MNDAPAAPEGWYPHPDSPGDERWWDGRAWTGATRPAYQTPTPETSAASPISARQTHWGLMWALIALAAILTVVGVNLLNVGGQISAADGGDSVTHDTSSEDRELPAGFEQIAPGIGMKETNRACEGWEKCVTADVFAVDGCPTHLAVEIKLHGKEQVMPGTTGAAEALEPAKKAPIVFGYRSTFDHTGYDVTSVKCR